MQERVGQQVMELFSRQQRLRRKYVLCVGRQRRRQVGPAEDGFTSVCAQEMLSVGLLVPRCGPGGETLALLDINDDTERGGGPGIGGKGCDDGGGGDGDGDGDDDDDNKDGFTPSNHGERINQGPPGSSSTSSSSSSVDPRGDPRGDGGGKGGGGHHVSRTPSTGSMDITSLEHGYGSMLTMKGTSMMASRAEPERVEVAHVGDMCGYLRKLQERGMRKYVRRWFALRRPHLFYFKVKPTHEQASQTARGVLDISSARVVVNQSTLRMKLIAGGPGGLESDARIEWTLEASSDIELDKWLAAIRPAVL